MALRDGDPIWFYELHEADDDLYADVLLAHDVEYDERELLDLVLEARAAVLESYTEDSLSEASRTSSPARTASWSSMTASCGQR